MMGVQNGVVSLLSFRSVTAVMLFAVGLACSTPLLADSMVSVVKHSFCKEVANLEPIGQVSDPAQLKAGENLNLWLEIKINSTGLKYLRALGKLPVYLHWGRDGRITDPSIDIGITLEAWQNKEHGINWKAREGGGTFTWRTHANKAASANGRYYASLIDANKKVIAQIELPGEPFRPEISVSRK